MRAPSTSRALIVVAAFVLGFLFISTAQDVRRCVTDLCSSFKTLYGTFADCRAPCKTVYGEHMLWPAVGASVLAFVAALRSAYLTHGLLEAYEEKLLPFGIAPQW